MAAKIWETLRTMRLSRLRLSKTAPEEASLHSLPQELYQIVEDHVAESIVSTSLRTPPFDFGDQCCQDYENNLDSEVLFNDNVNDLRNRIRKSSRVENFEELETTLLSHPDYAALRTSFLDSHYDSPHCITNDGRIKFWARIPFALEIGEPRPIDKAFRSLVSVCHRSRRSIAFTELAVASFHVPLDALILCSRTSTCLASIARVA